MRTERKGWRDGEGEGHEYRARKVGRRFARVRCGPRSTDSSLPELCPKRSRKIYNADVFSRRLSALRLLPVSFLRRRRCGRGRVGERGARGGAQRPDQRGAGRTSRAEPKLPSITRETKDARGIGPGRTGGRGGGGGEARTRGEQGERGRSATSESVEINKRASVAVSAVTVAVTVFPSRSSRRRDRL